MENSEELIERIKELLFVYKIDTKYSYENFLEMKCLYEELVDLLDL